MWLSSQKTAQGQNMNTSIIESNNWVEDTYPYTNAFNSQMLGGTLVMVYGNATENVRIQARKPHKEFRAKK